jgi:hypothetical protein
VAALAAGLLCLGVGPTELRAQGAPAQVTVDALPQVGFLVGQWRGDGWIELAPGRRVTFVETETATWKLGGLAMLIEGRGTQPSAGGTPADAPVVHEALALLTYDAAAERYNFRAYQGNMGSVNAVDADASVVDGALVWGFKPDPSASFSIRYTISLSDAGEWVEVGELAPDGQTWRQFFQMTLQRQAEPA